MKTKQLLLLLTLTLMGVSQVWAAAGNVVDWYLYYYKASDPALDGDYYHQFVETNETGVYEIAECSVPVNGLNFCVHDYAWSTKYGWSDAGVSSPGTPVALATATGATGWLGIPVGLYKVTLNTTGTNPTIQFDAVSVPTSVTIGETGYATFYSNCAYTMPDGVTGSIVTPGDAGKINVTEEYTAGENVPRWQGVLLKGTAGNYTLTYTGSVETAPTNRLSGSPKTTTVSTWTGDDSKNVLLYKLANDGSKGLGWYWDSDNGQSLNCGANKAYLWLTQTEANYSAGARSFFSLFGDDSETTGITDVKGKMEDVRGTYYDLSGRRVAQPSKGLYLVNGKKVVVK